MKIKSILLLIIISVSIVSCHTTNTNDGRNPLINNNSFTNYVPWWVTNDTSAIKK